MLPATSIVFLACTAGLGGDDWRGREQATHRVAIYAAANFDNWQRIKTAALSDDCPERRLRLRAIQYATAEEVAGSLLPSDYPFWPDIDHLAPEYAPYGLTALRKRFVKDNTPAMKAGNVALHGLLPSMHPQYRRATLAWTVEHMHVGLSPDTIREMLSHACIAEATEPPYRTEVLLSDPDIVRALIEHLPETINRRYFDGRRRHTSSG